MHLKPWPLSPAPVPNAPPPLHWLQVRVVVHPPIPPQDADSMLEQAQRVIAGSLPPSSISDEVRWVGPSLGGVGWELA